MSGVSCGVSGGVNSGVYFDTFCTFSRNPALNTRLFDTFVRTEKVVTSGVTGGVISGASCGVHFDTFSTKTFPNPI